MIRRPGRHLQRPRESGGLRKLGRFEWAAVATIVGVLVTLFQVGRSTGSPPPSQAIPSSTAPATTTSATTTTRSPTTTARPTTTTMSAAAAADSIWASVEPNPATIGTFSDIGYALIAPRGARIIGGPPGKDCAQFHPWVAEHGGVSAQSTFLRLVLQGKESNAVLLSSMRARIVERRAPLTGIPMVCGAAAGAADIHFIYLDLDKRPALGVHADLNDSMQVVRRKPFGFTLKKNETEVFDIWAVTEDCHCKWVIELDLVVNGRRAVKTVTNKGQPFQTTAWSGPRAYHWIAGAWYKDGYGEPLPRDRPLRPLS
jgi:hypothetical protein